MTHIVDTKENCTIELICPYCDDKATVDESGTVETETSFTNPDYFFPVRCFCGDMYFARYNCQFGYRTITNRRQVA